MKNLLVMIGVAVAAIFGYAQWQKWNTPPPAPVVVATPTPTPIPVPTPAVKPTPERHLTPEGAFALVDYVSVHTKTGVIGLEPGQIVKFVSANKTTGTLRVTDGTYQVDVKPDQITNDLDLARIAQRRDQESQQQLHTMLAYERDADTQARRDADIDRAKNVKNFRTEAAVGGGSTLSLGSSAASSYDAAYNEALRHRGLYNPYYYLNR